MRRQQQNGFDLVLDLMVSKDREVKILEFQQAACSAFSGYSSSYNNEIMWAKIEKLHKQENLKTTDAPVLLDEICNSKASQAVFAYPLFPTIFPWQKAYAYVGNEPPNTEIQANCQSTKIVIKVPTSGNGEGVFFADRKSFSIFDEPDEKAIFGSFFSPGTDEPAQNYIVAQDCVTPRAIDVAGQTYLPTIRTTLTIAWTGTDSEPAIYFHGHYYKLPAPQDDGAFRTDQLKSNVHSAVGAAPIEPIDKALIEEQVPAALRVIFTHCLRHNPEALLLDKLNSGNAGQIMAALSYAHSLDYRRYGFTAGFALQFEKIAPSIFQTFPKMAPHLFQDWRSGFLRIRPVKRASAQAAFKIMQNPAAQNFLSSLATRYDENIALASQRVGRMRQIKDALSKLAIDPWAGQPKCFGKKQRLNACLNAQSLEDIGIPQDVHDYVLSLPAGQWKARIDKELTACSRWLKRLEASRENSLKPERFMKSFGRGDVYPQKPYILEKITYG